MACLVFEGIESTIRRVHIELKKDVGVADLPHQLHMSDCQVLLCVPGRPPICLRCKQLGHIRKQCRTPWCPTCRRFGHDPDDCVALYASRLRAKDPEGDVSHSMDTDVPAEVLHPSTADAPRIVATEDASVVQAPSTEAEVRSQSESPSGQDIPPKKKEDCSASVERVPGPSPESWRSVGKGKRLKGDSLLSSSLPLVPDGVSLLEDMAFIGNDVLQPP